MPLALAFLVFGASGCDLAPSKDLIDRHRLVAEADNRVMTYVCPEAQRPSLESEDPLRSAGQFVQRGKGLEGWATELIDPYAPTPRNLVGPLDSLVAAIRRMASSFAPAVATFSHVERECYSEFSLNCDKLVRARDILSRIDAVRLHTAREDYFRHRAALAKEFAKADWPLTNLRTCGGE